VAGAVKLSDTAQNCSHSTDTGAVRFNSSTKTPQFCNNGSGWTQMQTVTAVDSTAKGADIGLTTLVTPAANNFYRVSCYVVLTRAATTFSTMPACNFAYTDESSTAHAAAVLAATSSANAVGTNSTGAAVLYAKSGVAIQYSTTGYNTGGATSMQYAVHVRLEQL
jgi:hypothetical protein